MDQKEISKVAGTAPKLIEFSAQAIRAYVEARAAQFIAKGRKVQIVCGVIVEEGEPTNGLNRQVRDEINQAMAASLRQGR